jgi:pyrroloquinoline quinone biosynthesis protein D
MSETADECESTEDMMAAISKMTDRFTETVIDDEIVIMRLDNGEFFALSGTAAATWRLIDGSRARATIVAALADEFAASESEIVPDVDDFLLRLKEMGLLAGA